MPNPTQSGLNIGAEIERINTAQRLLAVESVRVSQIPMQTKPTIGLFAVSAFSGAAIFAIGMVFGKLFLM